MFHGGVLAFIMCSLCVNKLWIHLNIYLQLLLICFVTASLSRTPGHINCCQPRPHARSIKDKITTKLKHLIILIVFHFTSQIRPAEFLWRWEMRDYRNAETGRNQAAGMKSRMDYSLSLCSPGTALNYPASLEVVPQKRSQLFNEALNWMKHLHNQNI